MEHLQALLGLYKVIWRGPQGKGAPPFTLFALPVGAPLVFCSFPPLHHLMLENSKAFGGSGDFCILPGKPKYAKTVTLIQVCQLHIQPNLFLPSPLCN